jgi:hypothetical protein
MAHFAQREERQHERNEEHEAVINRETLELCVRWYLTYRLSCRDLVEMMAERGVIVCHSTILRWVDKATRSVQCIACDPNYLRQALSSECCGTDKRVAKRPTFSSTTPRSLKVKERRALIRELKDAGLLDVRRRAMEIIALHLGVSRATVYSDAK